MSRINFLGTSLYFSKNAPQRSGMTSITIKSFQHCYVCNEAIRKNLNRFGNIKNQDKGKTEIEHEASIKWHANLVMELIDVWPDNTEVISRNAWYVSTCTSPTQLI